MLFILQNLQRIIYPALGCALALAGVMFARNYLCYHNLMEKEQEV